MAVRAGHSAARAAQLALGLCDSLGPVTLRESMDAALRRVGNMMERYSTLQDSLGHDPMLVDCSELYKRLGIIEDGLRLENERREVWRCVGKRICCAGAEALNIRTRSIVVK